MKTLAELQAENVPHASCETVGITLKGDESAIEDGKRIMDAYFNDFAASVFGNDLGQFMECSTCIRCGRPQAGIFGHFTWGLCRGEGYCSHCKYPARGIHQINDEGKLFATFSGHILQYHPSVLTENTEQMDAEGQVCRVG